MVGNIVIKKNFGCSPSRLISCWEGENGKEALAGVFEHY